MRNDVFSLTTRVLVIVVFIAAISALCEILFVLVMKGFNPAISFTGAYALVLFSAFCGIVPSWPTPSRLSVDQLDLKRRSLIFVEVSVLVATALLAFTWVQEERWHEFALVGLFSYLFIAAVFSVWRRMGAQNN